MLNKLHKRLEALRTEYQKGEIRAYELEMQQTHTKQTLLRIAGAIQVLEELLADDQSKKPSEDQPCIGGASQAVEHASTTVNNNQVLDAPHSF